MKKDHSLPIYAPRKERTLARSASYTGVGLHTGAPVTLTLHPEQEGRGIIIQRSDLPGKPTLPATIDYVHSTERCTTLSLGEMKVHTVEHVLSALKALQIDNARVELSAEEPPIADGSAAPFVQMIEECGIIEQYQERTTLQLNAPISWSEGEVHLVALPHPTFRVSYTLHYPDSKLLYAQYYSLEVTPENFKTAIAPCRTFSRYEEIAVLMDHGLIKGGSLSNAVIIKDDVILSKGGLHFQDEMVRHKILDVIGDLSLIGVDFQAHIIAIRSGHAANCAFAKKIYEQVMEKVG